MSHAQTDIGYILATEQPAREVRQSRTLRIHKMWTLNSTGGTTMCSKFTYPAERLTTDWDKVTCQRCLYQMPRGNLR